MSDWYFLDSNMEKKLELIWDKLNEVETKLDTIIEKQKEEVK